MLRNDKTLILFSIGLLSTLSFTVNAQSADTKHIIVAPQCLVKQLNANYKTLESSDTFTLIEVNNLGLDQLIEAKTHKTATPCGGFIDVTDDWQQYNIKHTKPADRAKFLHKWTVDPEGTNLHKQPKYSIKYPDQVNQLIKQIDSKQMWADLAILSSFPDRYAGSNNGVKAANWLKTQIETIAKNTGHDDVTVYTVATRSYKQPSVVAKIGNSTEPGVVIGGHMDTLDSTWGLKPGADDDGSGTVTTLGVARTLLSSGMHFKKPIYIIWYAAEEMGLKGSRDVVTDFKNKNIPVDAVIQFDMTGYADQSDPTLYLITDNVNKELTNYLETLVKTYVKQPVERTRCGYACSDHASWTKGGFAAAFPFEATFGHDDPYIHTSKDVMENVLSLDHITDYAKLGTAFAVELAEPIS